MWGIYMGRIELPEVFQNGMMFQREKAIKITARQAMENYLFNWRLLASGCILMILHFLHTGNSLTLKGNAVRSLTVKQGKTIFHCLRIDVERKR